jgi:hypothetical protein
MVSSEKDKKYQVREEWGSWKSTENDSAIAFKNRSPNDRLAWLEDLLRLRLAVLKSKK